MVLRRDTSDMSIIPFFTPPKRRVDRVFIHCSASDDPEHDDVSVIKKWHTSPSKTDPTKPWLDVGYHFYIKFDGTIQFGRSLEWTPSAQKSHNSRTIAICISGGEDGKPGAFTKAQFAALQALCGAIHIALPDVSFHGHREVDKYKICPVFDYKALLNLDNDGFMP